MAVQLHEFKRNNEVGDTSFRFERKFHVMTPEVGLVYGLLNHICLLDGEFPSEQINSLYFDTTGLDQHERSSEGDFTKDKIRIRWYGTGCHQEEEQTVFLELKSRRGFSSTKQRIKLRVAGEALSLRMLSKGIVERSFLSDALWGFGYFPQEPVIPVIKISYWRYRFSDIITGQRVSLDCHIRSTMILPGAGNGVNELELPGAVIEIKGRTMELSPALRKLKVFYLDWSRFSKYSSCIDSHCDDPGTTGYLSPSGKLLQQ